MQEVDTQYYVEENHTPPIKSFTILRPLLQYPKVEIQSYCDTQMIPYMIDQSNQDTSVSSRNLVRNTITSHLDSVQLQGRNDLYDYLESQKVIYPLPIRNETQ